MANNMTRVMSDGTYNGWRNRATWNVALWAQNDESIYRGMVEYCKTISKYNETRQRSRYATWIGFCDWQGLAGERTPDGVLWTGRYLDARALSAMLQECGQ